MKLQRAYQTRILHTAGSFGSLVNNGKVNVDTTGRIMILGSLMGTRMVNNGEINIEDHAVWLKNIVSYHYQFDPLATAFYEHFPANDTPCAPSVNHGKIKIHLYGTEESGQNAMACGFYILQVGDNGKFAIHDLENDGEISITQSGPQKYLTAEVGVNVQSSENISTKVRIGRWKTADKEGMIASKGAEIDLSQTLLTNLEGNPLSLDGIVKHLI